MSKPGLSQEVVTRLNWSRVSGMAFATAFHLAVFMILLSPSPPMAPPPVKEKPIHVVDVVEVKPEPRRVEIPMPKAPQMLERIEPVVTMPVKQEVAVVTEVVRPVLDSAEQVMIVAQPALRPTVLEGDVGPTTTQSYGTLVKPKYPSRARARHEEGVVLVRVLVGESGDPLKVETETSSGYKLLDKAALDAVKQWKFNPGRSNGKPVKGWVLVPINFSLTS